MKLAGRVAVVTGGGSGIGAAVAAGLAAEGAAVAVLDVDAAAAGRVAAELAGASAHTVDVTDVVAVDAAFARVAADHGRLDVLVNNAGIAGGEETARFVERQERQFGEAMVGPIETHLDVTATLADEQWRRMLATHLDGTFHCTRAALRIMGPQGHGVITNMASICGVAGCSGMPHYSAAKAGILGFTRSVAKEVVTQGIRVNAIAPGYVDTPLLDILTPGLRSLLTMQTPIGRMGTVQEIAAVAVFLATDDAGFFVGETISPNGGFVTV